MGPLQAGFRHHRRYNEAARGGGRQLAGQGPGDPGPPTPPGSSPPRFCTVNGGGGGEVFLLLDTPGAERPPQDLRVLSSPLFPPPDTASAQSPSLPLAGRAQGLGTPGQGWARSATCGGQGPFCPVLAGMRRVQRPLCPALSGGKTPSVYPRTGLLLRGQEGLRPPGNPAGWLPTGIWRGASGRSTGGPAKRGGDRKAVFLAGADLSRLPDGPSGCLSADRPALYPSPLPGRCQRMALG